MAGAASNPKAVKSTGNRTEGCLRLGGGNPETTCRDNHRCSECWFDSGEKVKDQMAEVKGAGMGWPVEMPVFVEDGISLLATLLSERRRVKTTFDRSPLTGYDPNPVDPHDGVFKLRGWTEKLDGEPLFVYGDLEATWHKHIGRSSWTSRQIKGREWAQIVWHCLQSIS